MQKKHSTQIDDVACWQLSSDCLSKLLSRLSQHVSQAHLRSTSLSLTKSIPYIPVKWFHFPTHSQITFFYVKAIGMNEMTAVSNPLLNQKRHSSPVFILRGLNYFSLSCFFTFPSFFQNLVYKVRITLGRS